MSNGNANNLSDSVALCIFMPPKPTIEDERRDFVMVT
jgi:hypothetical protein